MVRGVLRLRLVLAVALVVLGVAPSALAALPKAGGTYKGSGKDYFNNTPDGSYSNRVPGTPSQIKLVISSNRRKIKSFFGSYQIYCGSVTLSVKGSSISITPKGYFSISGSNQSVDPAGKVNGTTKVTLKGHFVDGGKKVYVYYTVVTTFASTPQAPCGTKVIGSAKLQ